MKKHTFKNRTNPEQNIIKHPLDEIVRRGAREMLQKAIEMEADLFLERYQYVLDDDGNRRITRNGHHKARKIITGAGAIEITSPRVDDRALTAQNESRFSSCIIPPYLRRTKNIDELLPVLYLKGISTGDFGEALESLLGKNVIGLSAQNIVRLKSIWQEEYAQWEKRDLSSKEYVYWWVDGIHFNVRLDDDRQCILVIIGARRDGVKEIVAIGDGALGFWAAFDEEFSSADQQLCWVHKTANVLDKLPKSQQFRAKTMIHEIYLSATKAEANTAFDNFIGEYAVKYPRAVNCLRDHRKALMTFYDYPAEQWLHIRTTNVIESTFATVRHRTRRTKGCGSRIATITMVFKLIQSAQKRWQRLRGYEKVNDVWAGIKFEDGLMVKEAGSQAAMVAA